MFVRVALVVLLVTCYAAQAQSLAVQSRNGSRFLRFGDRDLLELSTPWLATADYKSLYRFPAGPSANATTDNSAHGTFTEKVTSSGDSITIRYEFAIAPDPQAAHLQWVWRLEDKDWNGVMGEPSAGRQGKPMAVRPIDGLNITDLTRVSFILHDLDLTVTCTSSDGDWKFQDARSADWARCFRLEYNRAADVSGKRSGWLEATIKAKPATSPLVSLTRGNTVQAQRIDFQAGPVLDKIGRKLSHLVFLHTLTSGVPRGQTAGEIAITFADGSMQNVPLRSEQEFASPDDDPRSVSNGRMVNLPDIGRAWVSIWQNPNPDLAISRIDARPVTGGWRLIGASGIDGSADQRRVAALVRGDGQPLPEQTEISLDGTWKIMADGISERDIAVPSFWDGKLQNLHEAVYRRDFDIPSSFAGRRVAIRFDAVGDSAEVWVNGRMAGAEISPALPCEFDITGLVTIPSTGNTLEVRIKDDTHFAVPRADVPWRNARHWIPRGMGTNNRKGLYQSVSLVARPMAAITDVRVQTSTRKGEMLVTYTVRNSGKSAANLKLAGSVHPREGGKAVFQLPPASVTVPGYLSAQVSVHALFQGVELWQPNHPTLYSLRSLLVDGEKRVERVDTRIGFREAWFEGANFYLNGVRCNLRGESPAYSEKSDLMATRDAAAEMVRRYQQTNFNVLRFHSMPAPQHVLEVCDEMGMLVIDESAIYCSWGMLVPEHPDWMENCRTHLSKWVKRDRNHPSIVLWSAENEGLNVSGLTPAMLAEFKKIIDAEDGTRPVTFDGDGSAVGASQASNKHYVYTIADLKDQGGAASGYGRDLRSDIYWAAEYQQQAPLGCGEFLFPYEPGLRDKEREVNYMMGLQTRGYRFANWYDIRPYNPSYCGFLTKEGVRRGYEPVYEVVQKSFAPIAVFDKAYDAMGPFPKPPVLQAGAETRRELVVYNDAFEDERVEVEWVVRQGDRRLAGERLQRVIPLGDHVVVPIAFTPGGKGPIELDLISRKSGKETFRDTRTFTVE